MSKDIYVYKNYEKITVIKYKLKRNKTTTITNNTNKSIATILKENTAQNFLKPCNTGVENIDVYIPAHLVKHTTNSN